jgi:hypothetical protein
MAEPQHYLDLSHIGQQLQAHAALTASALIQGFQNQIIPAIQQQGANLADHVANMAGQRVQQALAAEGWGAAAEAVAIKGVELAGEGAAVAAGAALAPEIAAVGAGALAVGAAGLAAGSIVQNITHIWHPQNNQNTQMIQNIQMQAQHDVGNGRRPLRSARELNNPYPPTNHAPAVFQPPRREPSRSPSVIHMGPATPREFSTEPRRRRPSPNYQEGGASGSNDQPPPPPPGVPIAKKIPVRPETISTQVSTGEAFVKKLKQALKQKPAPRPTKASELQKRLSKRKDQENARVFREKLGRRNDKWPREGSEIRGASSMEIPGSRAQSARAASVPVIRGAPKSRAKKADVPVERGRPREARPKAKEKPERSRSKSKKRD